VVASICIVGPPLGTWTDEYVFLGVPMGIANVRSGKYTNPDGGDEPSGLYVVPMTAARLGYDVIWMRLPSQANHPVGILKVCARVVSKPPAQMVTAPVGMMIGGYGEPLIF
jgi:hypothetical protein